MIAKNFPSLFRTDRFNRIPPDTDAFDPNGRVGFHALLQGPVFVGLGVDGGAR
jgi:hypothetical protein